MEDGPTRTHTLHTIGSGADTRHAVIGRSTGSGLLDALHIAHRQLTRWRYIVGFAGTGAGEEGGAQGWGHRTHELTTHPAPGAVARASAEILIIVRGEAVQLRHNAVDALTCRSQSIARTCAPALRWFHQ